MENETWMVWRGDQIIGASFKDEASAKSYAKRNASPKQDTFYVGRGKKELKAELSLSVRSKWVKA